MTPLKILVTQARRSPSQDLRTRRISVLAIYAGLLLLAFGVPLIEWARYAVASDLHSHVLLIPLVTAYLIFIRRDQLPKEWGVSPGWTLAFMTVGAAAIGGDVLKHSGISRNDHVSLMAFSFVCFLWAGGFLCLGPRWMTAAAFPMAFLIFMAPLPDGLVNLLETGSKLASAEAAAMFFDLFGTPVLREGTIFQLPNIVLRVAQECSGIRSSCVLFITSLVAADVFLKTPWKRFLLVSLVIPLGILRNGFRIFVIGFLCVNVGPHMVHSAIHHRGGPIFFVLSLIPLFVLLWWLRASERPAVSGER